MPRSKKLITLNDAKRIRKMAETDAVAAAKELRETIAVRTGVEAARSFSIDAIKSTSKRRTPRGQTGSFDQEFSGSTDYDTLIATGRDIFQNFSFGAGIVNSHVKNMIGIGPILQLVTDDDEYNRRGEAYWNRKKNTMDVAGKTFVQNVKIGERREVEDGDYGIVFLRGGRTQYIEADRIGGRSDEHHKRFQSDTVSGGVERRKSGELVQFHVYNRGRTAGRKTWARAYPAKDFVHCYNPKRFDQSRGACWMTAALNDLRDLQETLEAAKGKWKIDNMLGVAITSAMPESSELASLWGVMTQFDGTDAEGNTQDNYEVKLQQGVHSFEMRPGDDIKVLGNTTPNTTFEPMTILIIRIVALTLDMPLEIALQYFTRGSYSAHRAAFLQYWEAIKARRKDIEEIHLDRLVRWTLRRAIKSGKLKGPRKGVDPDVFKWQWPGFPILDPDKRRRGDREGYKLRVESLSDITGRDGKFWQDVALQIIREIKWITEQAEKEGVDPALVLPLVTDPGQEPPIPDDDDDDKGND